MCPLSNTLKLLTASSEPDKGDLKFSTISLFADTLQGKMIKDRNWSVKERERERGENDLTGTETIKALK